MHSRSESNLKKFLLHVSGPVLSTDVLTRALQQRDSTWCFRIHVVHTGMSINGSIQHAGVGMIFTFTSELSPIEEAQKHIIRAY